MRPPLSFVPALPAAAGLVAGIIASEWGYGWICSLLSVAAFVAFYAFKRHYAAFISLSAAAGALLALSQAPSDPPPNIVGRPALCAGTLLNASIGENAQRCVVRIETADSIRLRQPFLCVVFNRHISPGLLPGAKVKFYAEIHPITAPGHIPYEADYGRYLKYEGITAQAVIYNESMAVTEKPGFWHGMVNGVRESMASAISQSRVSPQTAAFLLTTIMGEDDFLSPDVRTGFRTAGLSHILALSGLHVGIIASLLTLMLFPLRLLPGGRRTQSVITILMIWIYALATGLGPSVTRAAVMLTALILARLLERSHHSFNSLFVALIVVLAINPYSLFTPGLQMSFAAVCAILLAMRLVPASIYRRPALAFMLGLIIVPVAAMLGTGIIGAYYFHEMPLLFLPVNIAMALVFPPLLAAGVALMLVTMAGVHATWLALTADFLYAALTDLASAFAGVGHWRGIFFSAWVILPYWIGLILLGEWMRRLLSDRYEYDRHRKSLCIWGIACMLTASGVYIAMRKPTPQAELYMPLTYPPSLIAVTPDHAYLMPIGKRVDMADAIDRYNSRYSTYLMSRGHEGFRIMPDSVMTGPFYRRGPLLLAADRLIFIVDSDTLAAPPTKPWRILIGNGYTGPLNAIASAGDTVIICSGVNGNRAASLRRQASDTIYIASPIQLSAVY